MNGFVFYSGIFLFPWKKDVQTRMNGIKFQINVFKAYIIQIPLCERDENEITCLDRLFFFISVFFKFWLPKGGRGTQTASASGSGGV
ncbi:MAG: hypothetical protein HUK40_12300 [Desulfobacter sp.]|nr:hypothetical protein [Desulfobacter sp.]